MWGLLRTPLYHKVAFVHSFFILKDHFHCEAMDCFMTFTVYFG